MIIKKYDQGWGPEWELKKFESTIIDAYLRPLELSDSAVVVINSTWYTDELHSKVLEQLKILRPDMIVLIAMLDSAIPRPNWFDNTGIPAMGVGYYAGDHYIDWWALVVEKYMKLDHYDLVNHASIDTAFMSLNRKPHWHRRKLYQALEHYNLLDHGIVSMGGDEEHSAKRILETDQGCTDIAPNAGTAQHGIANDIASLGHPTNWQRHFLNIVSETMWHIDDHRFVSEKIFKPIIGQRPFLVYDVNGACDWLTSNGFESYVGDFKDISDLDLTVPNNIPLFLTALTGQKQSYYQSKYVALKEKIQYNRSMFTKHVNNQKIKVQQGIPCQI